LAGLGVFLAIFLHKPLDALTITSLMAVRDWPRRKRAAVNIMFSLMCPLGALLFYAGVGTVPHEQDFVKGVALAFSAGVFLCISLSDLLPEVQFHSHDRLSMSGMLLLGVAIAIALEMIPF
jgi:zinc and cadmium transporter